MDYPTYQAVVIQALGDLYTKTLSYLPNLVAAIIVVIIGWLLAIFLSKLVYKVLEAIKIDHLANQLGLKNLSENWNTKFIKWIFSTKFRDQNVSEILQIKYSF